MAKLFKARRKKVNRNQEQMADKAGISRNIASNLENGSRNIFDPAFLFMFEANFPTPKHFFGFILKRLPIDSWEEFSQEVLEKICDLISEYLSKD